jgi:ADP-ribose pyrophosphatase YjhB (NUDIX family)
MSDREYPVAPVLGVGAVVLDGARVLLVKRANPPMQGEWSLPGGALELGETLHAGCIREVQEETGLRVEVVSLIELLDRIVFADPEKPAALDCENRIPADDKEVRVRYHYVLADYYCRVNGGHLKADSDAAEAAWVELDRLERGFPPIADFTLAVIRKARERRDRI